MHVHCVVKSNSRTPFWFSLFMFWRSFLSFPNPISSEMMTTLPVLLCLQVLLLCSASFSHGSTEPKFTNVEVVAYGECAACAEKSLNPSHAFSGLGVTIDCKVEKGHFERKGSGKLDEQGKFRVSLPNDLLKNDGALKQDCYAQLHSASNTPCPAINGLESSKIVFISKSEGKHLLGLKQNLKFSPEICSSAFLWPFPKFPFKGFPFPFPSPPNYESPAPVSPPTPEYQPPVAPPPTPVYEKPLPPPAPPKVELPPPSPIYKPPKKELPPPVPIYKPPKKEFSPPVPIYKPPKEELPPPVPIYKKPCPPLPPKKEVPPPVPIYKPPKKELPPPVPIYKPPKKEFPPPVPIYKPPVPPAIPKIKKPYPPKPPVVLPPSLPSLPKLPPLPPKYFPRKPWPPTPPLSNSQP